MSVTIVSTANVNAAPSVPDASAGDAASGDDFANVLQGQLALSAAQTPAATGPTAGLPIAAATADDDRDSSEAGSDAAFDASSLLATMAFAAPAVSVDNAKAAGDSDGTARASALPTNVALGTTARTDDTATPSDESPSPAAAGDAAAKFAVATASVEDTPIASKALAESTTHEPALPTENIHAAGHTAVGKHPAHSESALSVTTPVRNPDWAGDFGQKIVWLATSETQSAQLTLNPPQLGPIDISLSIDSGHASVSFASGNAEVRNAIESALPRLREMLANSGIELGQTNVGAESFRQSQQGAWGSSSASRSLADNAILAADSAQPLHARTFAVQRGNGLVDLFA